MGLREKANASMKARGGVCIMRLLQLSDSERDELAELLADPAMPSSAIARALTDEGYEVTAVSVQRHRRGECRCPR